MIQHPVLRSACLALFVLALWTLPAHAQRTSGAVGLGGQVGEPSGITLKVYNEGGPSYDFLAAWDLDDFFFLNGHALWENDINAENLEQDLEWFIGPGAFIGFREDPADGPNDEDETDVVLGISGSIGLNFVIDRRFEIYGQLTPRISLVPDTDGDIGGGVGFRYYF